MTVHLWGGASWIIWRAWDIDGFTTIRASGRIAVFHCTQRVVQEYCDRESSNRLRVLEMFDAARRREQLSLAVIK